jgi:hypothetical protein
MGSVLGVTVFLAAGCGSVDSINPEDSGSVFTAGNVVSSYLGKDTENQVDIHQDMCTKGAEPFSDHFGKVPLSNKPWPNHEEQTASTVYLTNYRIDYTRLDADAPDLPSVTLNKSATILPCDPDTDCSTEVTLIYMPVATKQIIEAYYCPSFNPDGTCATPHLPWTAQRTYDLLYTINGVNEYGEAVSAITSSEFLVSDYDLCAE